MKSLKTNGKKTILALFGAVLVIAIAVSISLFLRGKGTLIVSMRDSGTNLFINQKEYPNLSEGKHSFRLPYGSYTVVTSRPDHWPWGKQVEISHTQTELSPLMISQDIPSKQITQTDKEFAEIIPMFNTPQSEYATSSDASVSIKIDGNKIIAFDLTGGKNPLKAFCIVPDQCVLEAPIFIGADEKVKANAFFYKDRNDFLIVSYAKNIFILEIEKVGNQNFQPIFEGLSPIIRKDKDGNLYVVDNKKLYKIEL